MEKRCAVVILMWNRLEITKETVNSLLNKNEQLFDIIFVDNASDDGSSEYFASLGYKVLTNLTNEGIFMGTRRGWLEAHKLGYDFILNLQNDFPCIRKIPFQDIFTFLESNRDVGFVQLNDKSRMLQYSRGKFKVKNSKRLINKFTKSKLKFGEFKQYGDTLISKGNHHMSFNPVLMWSEIAKKLVDDTSEPREFHIMKEYTALQLKSSKLRKPCFETILRPRFDGWLH